MGKRRPWQLCAGALRLGRGRLRLRAANCGNTAFTARDALRSLVDVADRALAPDRAVRAMRRRDAEALRQQFFRIAIAPAQETDDVERLHLAEQLCAGILFGPAQRLFQQIERLEAVGDLFRMVDDLADADDDGNAVWGAFGLVGHGLN